MAFDGQSGNGEHGNKTVAPGWVTSAPASSFTQHRLQLPNGLADRGVVVGIEFHGQHACLLQRGHS